MKEKVMTETRQTLVSSKKTKVFLMVGQDGQTGLHVIKLVADAEHSPDQDGVRQVKSVCKCFSVWAWALFVNFVGSDSFDDVFTESLENMTENTSMTFLM
jgi:hypothetical protein